MKIKLRALAGAALLLTGGQQTVRAQQDLARVDQAPGLSSMSVSGATTTGAQSQELSLHKTANARPTNYESRLSGLAHKPYKMPIKAESVVDAVPDKLGGLFGLTETPDSKNSRSPKSGAMSSSAKTAGQPAGARGDRSAANTNNVASDIKTGNSEILNTVLTKVPAGKNSPFKIPAWLLVKRPQDASIDSATYSPAMKTASGSDSAVVTSPVAPPASLSSSAPPASLSSSAPPASLSSTARPVPPSPAVPPISPAASSPTLLSTSPTTTAPSSLLASTQQSLTQQYQSMTAPSAAVPDLSNPAGATSASSTATAQSAGPGTPDLIATNPQQAVLQDPDASGKPKIAQNDPNNGSSSEPARRGYPAPLDPVFPSTEYIGIAGTMPIGVPDTDPEFPLEKQIYKVIPQLKQHRIKIYGWINPGGGYSSSRNSNIPQSYSVVPKRIELDQAIFRVERCPDTVQQEHVDWGFRATMLYGIDYRWTTSQGWYPATKELLQHNYLYGLDPVELYGMFYIPKIAGHKIFQGMVFKYGRFISPPDIEAQLAPDNFLWTHSVFFTVDCYTQTGFINTIKLNDNWSVQAGFSAGADIAPWDKAAIPTGLFLARWVSKNNNDSIYGGLNSINNGRFRGAHAVLGQQQMIQSVNGLISQQASTGGPLGPYQNFDGSTYQYNNLQPPAHDNLQQINLTWSHRFNKKGTIVTMTEGYFLWQYNALVGGTVNNGPPHTYAGLTGPGAYINGIAPVTGCVNYTVFKVTDKDYMTIRPIDFLIDYKGERTGFPTAYESWTVGWAHRFNNLMMIRPEIRYERALNYHEGDIVKPYDNGTRRYQFTFGLDLIARF